MSPKQSTSDARFTAISNVSPDGMRARVSYALVLMNPLLIALGIVF